MTWVTYIVIGLVAGLLARAIVPGKQAMGLVGTTLLGIVGSLLGGIVGSIFAPQGPSFQLQGSGIIMSVVGAVLVLLGVGFFNTRRRVTP
jgi:uncharacterized membrane protein YeaQ/YmgE (transglycosylase-associated protein family)